LPQHCRARRYAYADAPDADDAAYYAARYRHASVKDICHDVATMATMQDITPTLFATTQLFALMRWQHEARGDDKDDELPNITR